MTDTSSNGKAKGKMFWGYAYVPATMELLGTVRYKHSEGALFKGAGGYCWMGNAGVLSSLPQGTLGTLGTHP